MVNIAKAQRRLDEAAERLAAITSTGGQLRDLSRVLSLIEQASDCLARPVLARAPVRRVPEPEPVREG
jgi:hypothetical protein